MHTSKHAVVALSEHLAGSLKERQAPIGVSVLCPGWVNTQIRDSARNRPAALENPVRDVQLDLQGQAWSEVVRRLISEGMPPAQIAEHVFSAVRAGQLYILTHLEFNQYIHERLQAIVAEML